MTAMEIVILITFLANIGLSCVTGDWYSVTGWFCAILMLVRGLV